MDSTKLVAWWGGILSTIVFAWDIYKYRHTGPQLRFQVRTGMVIKPSEDNKLYIQTMVTNRGDRPTTLTGISLYYFARRKSWPHWRNRPTIAAVLNPKPPLPVKLGPGDVWRGLTEQDREIETWGRDETGALYFALFHTHQAKPLRQHVMIR